MAWWLTLAWGGPVDIAIEDLPLRPDRPVQVTVVSLLDEVPPLAVEGGGARLDGVEGGVATWTVVPGEGPLTMVAGPVLRRFDVQLPSPSALSLPERTTAPVGNGAVRFVVGPPGLTVDALEVKTAEGRLVDMTPVADGIEVALEVGDSPFPRVVAVGVRDLRHDDQPAWTHVRLRARPRIPITAEPGATLSLRVSDREYGPFVADAQGRIAAVVDQYPGDMVARATLVDDLGNQVVSDLPLTAPKDLRLMGMVAGTLTPEGRAPSLFLHAWRDDGTPIPPGLPACRTPDTELTIRPLDRGAWVAALPAVETDAPSDLRVSCSFGPAQASLRALIPEGIAQSLQLRVFPEDLRAGFPEAEVRLVLEDARGDRLDTAGVALHADLGVATLQGVGGLVRRGDYDGSGASEAGRDVLRATYRSPQGEGAPRYVRAGWQRLADGGIEVFARASDHLGRPLADVPLEIGIGPGSYGRGVTDTSGYLVVRLAPEDAPAGDVVRFWGASTAWRGEAVIGSGPRGGVSPPGGPDLVAEQPLRIRAGSLAGISLAVDPPLLRAAPGAVAWVYVTLEDRRGLPILEAPLEVEASEGTVSNLRQRGDGRWVGEYVPPPGGAVRDVTITASSEGVRSSTKVTVQPRVVRLSLGPWAGWVTNFGEVGTWAVGADLDLRVRSRLVGEAVMLRFGGFGYGVATDLPGSDPALSLRGSVYPIHGALLLRQDAGAYALWGGGGAAVAVHRLQLRSGDAVITEGFRALGGPQVLGGVARRALGGEVLFELRGMWLNGPTGDVGYSGNLGGLAAGLGWRVVY